MRRPVWTVVAVSALVNAAGALTVRYVPIVNRPLIAIAALSPYLMVGAPIALIVFTLLHRWAAALLAAAPTIACVAVQLPLYVGTGPADGVPVRFMSANLRYGHADAATVVRLATENADILAVQELTLEEGAVLPPRVSTPRSRTRPFGRVRGLPAWASGAATRRQKRTGRRLLARPADSAAPAAGRAGRSDDRHHPHVCAVARSVPRMARRHGAAVRRVAADRGLGQRPSDGGGRSERHPGCPCVPAVVARWLSRCGRTGRCRPHPHPADVALLPPVFAVDHILIRDTTATSVRTVGIPGSTTGRWRPRSS
jgi:hypothetical protein